ncbi:MAG: hypothetical protein ACRC53_00120 [Plesiomonas sp.]|uniref:hypothetical protein n=1 Tax=Plesiomonas sp. TaxID=2486279 RepID=UPI003F321E36
MTDLFIESLALQRIQLITRVVSMDVCNGDDKTLALVWISELTDQLLEQLGNDKKQVVATTCQFSYGPTQQNITANYQS